MQEIKWCAWPCVCVCNAVNVYILLLLTYQTEIRERLVIVFDINVESASYNQSLKCQSVTVLR